jgi:hypothetical protein
MRILLPLLAALLLSACNQPMVDVGAKSPPLDAALGLHGDAGTESAVRNHLAQLYGVGTRSWQHVATYPVRYALPAMLPPLTVRHPVALGEWLFVAEVVELPREVHPWFVGVQFHPEFTSTPRDGHPLFRSYVEAAIAHSARRAPVTQVGEPALRPMT